ncbi:hypothetical protein [Arachidicoccus soli]|nr:hypothetical protein [Arachidicoccus soli]
MCKVFISVFFLMICINTFAQTKNFYGKILDSVTYLPVQDVQIENLNTHATDVTNTDGLFLIKASLNDSLSILRVGYYDTKYVINKNSALPDTLLIMITPKTEDLQSVTVSSYSYADYQADSLQRRRDFESLIGYPHRMFSQANTGAGIGLSLDRLFGRKDRNKKRAYRFLLENEQQEYIDFRFNPILIHSYTGLRGDSLKAFIHQYEPSYEWLRTHTDNESIMYYINEKLKVYNHSNK